MHLNVVVWGDSLAAALADGVDMIARERGLSGVLIATDSCPPIEGLQGGFRASMQLCTEVQTAVPRILAKQPVDVLIVHASWKSHYLRHEAQFADAVRKAFSAYKHLARKVVIVSAVPGARVSVPNAMARASAFGASFDMRNTNADMATLQAANDIVRKSALENGYSFVDIVPFLCRNMCQPYTNERPLYFDDGHIRAETSRDVAQRYKNALLPAASSATAFRD